MRSRRLDDGVRAISIVQRMEKKRHGVKNFKTRAGLLVEPTPTETDGCRISRRSTGVSRTSASARTKASASPRGVRKQNLTRILRKANAKKPTKDGDRHARTLLYPTSRAAIASARSCSLLFGPSSPAAAARLASSTRRTSAAASCAMAVQVTEAAAAVGEG